MKIVIAGSRTIEDPEFVFFYIEQGLNILKRLEIECTEVVSGVARGVDIIGEKWANKNNILISRHYANWEKEGRAAGPIRNEKMAIYTDAGIILNENNSRGAANMAACLLKHNKPHIVFEFKDYKEVARHIDGVYIKGKKMKHKYKHPDDAIWRDWDKTKRT